MAPDGHCKKPIEEIQATVDGTISRKQAAKLNECMKHIDKIRTYKQNIELEIQRLAEPYSFALDLLYFFSFIWVIILFQTFLLLKNN